LSFQSSAISGNNSKSDSDTEVRDPIQLLVSTVKELSLEVSRLRTQLSLKETDVTLGASDGVRPLVIGITDLAKKNEEAIFDALSAFEKRCPYCDRDQYRTGIRDRIEIDHFLPVSRGGQDVPWNILPVCKACNRQKRDKLPSEFLDGDTFRKCNSYLQQVRTRYHEDGVRSYESFAHLKALVEKHRNFIESNFDSEFLRELIAILSPDLASSIAQSRTRIQADSKTLGIASNRETFGLVKISPSDNGSAESDLSTLEQCVRRDMRARRGVFASGVIAGPWQQFCDLLLPQLPTDVVGLTPRALVRILEMSDWHHCGRVYSKEYTTKKDLYCCPELASRSASELRRIAEQDFLRLRKSQQ
jgi:hypothetical protein